MNNQEGMLAVVSALRGQGAGRLLGPGTLLPWAHTSPGHGPMGPGGPTGVVHAERGSRVRAALLELLCCSAEGDITAVIRWELFLVGIWKMHFFPSSS